MKTAPKEVTELDFQDPVELIEKYKQEHPELADALRTFEISNESYEQAVRAMYGDQVSWSTSVNPSLPTA
jgi:hypothetical protein